MVIKERIKLKDKNYYICVECEYNMSKDGYTRLEIKNYRNKYFDGGDLSILIKTIEANYNESTYKKYDEQKWFLSDCLYIYDNIPFISGVGDFYVSSKDGVIYSLSYLTKEELDKYIKEKNIKMRDNSKFSLGDGRTWQFEQVRDDED